MGKLLILSCAPPIAAGLPIEYGNRIPYPGRLPGDIVIETKNARFYFPIVTSIALSVVISLLIFIINKLRN